MDRIPMMSRSVLLAVAFICIISGCFVRVSAQQSGADSGLPAIPLVNGIHFDGKVSEPDWDRIPPLHMVQHVPTYNAPMSEQTEIRLAMDDRYLYLAAKCYDTLPSTQTTLRRDAWDNRDDQIAILVDSYDDRESGLVFVVYSTGARIDASFSNDSRTGNDVNVDWNSFWDALVSKDESGWQAEMRIPFTSLRFQPKPDGTVVMGIGAYRHIARSQELHVFPDVPPNWGFWSFMKPSKSVRYDFGKLESKLPVQFSPYALGGLGQNFDLNEDESMYVRDDKFTYDAGFDLKVGLTSNLTLDLTANTDFAQVEADNQQVNLTRFSLFFPEKRQFFLERTSNFDFSFGSSDRVFYTRRIGLRDGDQVPIIGGARIVGRVGGWDVGFLSMQTAKKDDLPTENSTVLRLKKSVLNDNSFIGGIATSLLDANGFYNFVYGLDARLNVKGDEYLVFNWAQSFEDQRNNELVSLDNSRVRLQWLRARDLGLGYNIDVSRAQSEYRPLLGFQSRKDFSRIRGVGSWTWRPEDSSPISSHGIEAENQIYVRNIDGDIETYELELQYSISTRTSHSFTAGTSYTYENLIDGFDLSDEVTVYPGEYRFVDHSLEYSMPGGMPLRTNIELDGGSFFDGWRLSPSINPVWSVTPNLELRGSYGYNRIWFPGRGSSFNSHLSSARIDLMLNTRTTFSSFVQYSSAADVFVGNVRFRYNPRDGIDFYLVYNELINTDRNGHTPMLPFTSNRTILAKYTYTFLR